jgi:hypothetical protein
LLSRNVVSAANRSTSVETIFTTIAAPSVRKKAIHQLGSSTTANLLAAPADRHVVSNVVEENSDATK